MFLRRTKHLSRAEKLFQRNIQLEDDVSLLIATYFYSSHAEPFVVGLNLSWGWRTKNINSDVKFDFFTLIKIQSFVHYKYIRSNFEKLSHFSHPGHAKSH